MVSLAVGAGQVHDPGLEDRLVVQTGAWSARPHPGRCECTCRSVCGCQGGWTMHLGGSEGEQVSREGRERRSGHRTGLCARVAVLQEPEAGRRGQRLPSLVLGGCARWEEGAEGGQRTPLIIQDVWQGPGGRGSCRSDT